MSRIRGRVAAILALVVVVAASGFLLDRKGPKAAGVGAKQNTETGAWFCPHGGIAGGSGWVVVTNPGTQGVTVRVTTFGKSGVVGISSFPVPAGQEVYQDVPATEAGAASEVEYFGDWVGAAAIVQGGKTKDALAGERCVNAPHRTWFLPDQPTGRGETAFAVVMNPFSTLAQFDVIVRTERRTISPKELTPYVLAPKSSVAIKVNDFALEAPGETTVTTELIQRIGRVVAGSFAVTPGSLRAEAGLSAPERQWVLPGSDRSGSTTLPILNPGQTRTDVTVVRQGSTIQEVLSGENGLSLPPGGVLPYRADHMEGAGLTLQTTDKGRIATAAVLSGPGADTATVDGTVDAASRWLVLPTLPASGGQEVLVLQNPGRVAVEASIRVIGQNGSLDLAGLGPQTVPAGRTVVVPLQTATGLPVSAVVTSTGGTFVAAIASYVGDGSGYAATLGLPMTDLG